MWTLQRLVGCSHVSGLLMRIPAKSPPDSDAKSPGVPIDVARVGGATGAIVFASRIEAVKMRDRIDR
jgi:hypothetical protein